MSLVAWFLAWSSHIDSLEWGTQGCQSDGVNNRCCDAQITMQLENIQWLQAVNLSPPKLVAFPLWILSQTGSPQLWHRHMSSALLFLSFACAPLISKGCVCFLVLPCVHIALYLLLSKGEGLRLLLLLPTFLCRPCPFSLGLLALAALLFLFLMSSFLCFICCLCYWRNVLSTFLFENRFLPAWSFTVPLSLPLYFPCRASCCVGCALLLCFCVCLFICFSKCFLIRL